MAHNINFRDGKASMAYFGEVPWHGLGTKVDHVMTAAEVMKESQMDFDVEKRQVYFQNGDGFSGPIEDRFATVRTDTNEYLGIVSDNYQIIQNSDAFVFFDSLVGEGEAIYHTAGVLGRGEKIWVLAKMPDFIELKTANGKSDIIEKYVLLTTGHDGSNSTIAKITPIRVVCQNTLNASLNAGGSEIRIRHTVNALQKLEQAHKILGMSNTIYDSLNDVFQKMALANISDDDLMKYVENLIPKNEDAKFQTRRDNQIDSIVELYHEGNGSDLSEGTVWGAYNAVTEYVDHVKTANKKDRLSYVWFGGGENLKQRAFDLAAEMVQ